jgi:hypothetical protein
MRSSSSKGRLRAKANNHQNSSFNQEVIEQIAPPSFIESQQEENNLPNDCNWFNLDEEI